MSSETDWVLVPRNPTEAMLDSAESAMIESECAYNAGEHDARSDAHGFPTMRIWQAVVGYRAMLAAAPQPPSAPVGVEGVDAAAWNEALELPPGFRVAEHLPGIWEYQFDIEDEADDDSDRKVSGTSWNHPALAAIAAWSHAYDALAPQPPAEAQPVACDEDRFEQFLQAAIARSPEPLRELGEYLSGVLDDDQWPAADRLLLQLATTPPSAPVGVEGVRHEIQNALRELDAVMTAEGNTSDAVGCAELALQRALEALAQQPAAVDSEMVKRAVNAYDEATGEGWQMPCLQGMRAALTAALTKQPAAVDGDNPYPAPRNRQEAAALAKLALAYLGVTSAHIDAAVARCETDLAAQPGGGK